MQEKTNILTDSSYFAIANHISSGLVILVNGKSSGIVLCGEYYNKYEKRYDWSFIANIAKYQREYGWSINPLIKFDMGS